MLRPIGNLPPAVYWRRRLVALGAVVVLLVLLVLTVKALSGGDGSPAAAATSGSPAPSSHVVAPPPTTQHASSAARSTGKHSKAAKSPSKTTVPPKPCTNTMLKVQAVVEHASYSVGDEPVVMLEALDTASAPCVQDFGDGHVDLRIYNGESRVWGSNDCGPKAAAIERTLMPNKPVRVRVTWSGLSSQPSLCDHRQRVGAGTYTLYASLSGKQGTATQFVLN